MFRQMGIGAVATLTAGLLAVGCSDSSSGGGFIAGGSGDTSLQNFNATPILTNNKDSDGAAFSPNNTNFQDMKVVFSNDVGSSDGTFGGDSSAMVIFQVTDNNAAVAPATSALQRVMASHYSGGDFTPPVELQAEDRDERTQTNIQAVVALQLATSAYGTASSTAVNDTRANNGNWLILWDYTTLFQDPRLSQNSTTNAVGAHRTIGATVFLTANRGTAVTTSTKVGGVSRTFRYGFQETALEVPTVKNGAVTGHNVTSVQQPANMPPAADVTSFGLVSNGFAAQASFGGDALPFSDSNHPGSGRFAGGIAGQTSGPQSSVVTTNAAGNYVFAHPNMNGGNAGQTKAVLRSASYAIGERTDFVHLFYTQVVSSLSGIGTFTQTGIAGGNSNDGGADLAAFTASFNMATLVFGNRTEFVPPVERNATTTALKAGTGFYPSFHVYNQHIFFKYADASLITNNIVNSDLLSLNGNTALSQNRVFGHEGKSNTSNNTFWEDIIGYATVTDAGDGTSTIGANAAKRDLSLHGTAGAHNTTNPTGSVANATNLINTLPNREMQNFNGSGQFIFGADEGLGDTTIFYLSADSTRDGTGALAGDINPTNIDATLTAAVVNNDGALTNGVNPRRVSVHKGDFIAFTDLAFTNGSGGGSTDNTTLQDPLVEQGALSGVGGTLSGRNGSGGAGMNVAALTAGTVPTYFHAAMNRTGEYVALNWIQDQGVSSLGGTTGGAGFYQALFATVYQTFRPTTTGTGGTTTAAAVEARFATAPLEVSVGTGALALSQNVTRQNNVQNNGPETNGSWIGLPVNWSSFQGGLGYRCGFQSNNRIMNMFWEQSDGTEDRLFTRDLTVTTGATGTPTLALGTAAEFDSTPSVQGHQSDNQFAGGNTTGPALGSINNFRFLDGGIYSFASVDLGPDATAVSATNQGGVLVVLGKVIDGTTTDNELADAEVAAFEVLRGTAAISAANRTSLSRNITENAPVLGIQQGGSSGGGTLTQFLSTNASAANNYNAVFRTGSLLQLVATPRNTTITGTLVNHSPTRVDVVFSDSRTDNNSGARVLYARRYDSKDRALTAPKANAGDRFNPIGTVGNVAPAEPIRLDRLQGGNVTAIVAADSAGAAMFVVWTQDGHGWAQYTSDGITYRTTAGAPTPPLVDDNNSENIVRVSFFKGENSSCDVGDGITLITKRDVTGGNDTRAYMRGLARP